MEFIQKIVNSLIPTKAIKTEVDVLLDNRQLVLVTVLIGFLFLLYFTLKLVIK